ncbi:lysophospholipid acyltransferase family protein [Tautonia sp. JC769]|uniref:lysophospholipid acyltransferase family protein n=1 Tax=Tautonia sp. JC769 TaxID=3232135 RepID=UPI0034578C42
MTAPESAAPSPRRRDPGDAPRHDRPWIRRVGYRLTQWMIRAVMVFFGGFRVSGQENVPGRGAALLVSNHLSFWDVLVLGSGVRRPVNFVARSSLFSPKFGGALRFFGAFPIQRDGFGSQGFKETLRRLKAGGIVTFFPEGTRSPDGTLQELKPGIAALATRARVPILPAGIAGTFESWPRDRKYPRPHPMRLHLAPSIAPEELDGLSPEDATRLIRDRLEQAIEAARQALPAARRPAIKDS